jgi:hypothetical protein
MKTILHRKFATPALMLIGSLVAAPPLTAGQSVGKVSVMEIEDVRDAATIARAKAQIRAEQGAGGGAGGIGSTSGCSDLNIGNVQPGVGGTVPRNLTIVVEGPIIQENDCR